MASGVDSFLTIKREMVAVLAHQHLSQKPRSGQTAFEKAFRQFGHDGSQIPIGAMRVLRANQTTAEEAARLVIELFTHFLTNPPPLLRLSLYGFGFQDLLHHGQVLWQPLPAFLPRPGNWRHGLFLHLRRRCLRQSQEEFQLILGDLLTGGTEHPLENQIQLLAKQDVLASRCRQFRERPLQGGVVFGGLWRRLQRLLIEHLACRA